MQRRCRAMGSRNKMFPTLVARTRWRASTGRRHPGWESPGCPRSVHPLAEDALIRGTVGREERRVRPPAGCSGPHAVGEQLVQLGQLRPDHRLAVALRRVVAEVALVVVLRLPEGAQG